jgi:hypothetical protein
MFLEHIGLYTGWVRELPPILTLKEIGDKAVLPAAITMVQPANETAFKTTLSTAVADSVSLGPVLLD